MYYFDHSATTPLLPEITKLMNNINEEVYGNPSSVYSLGRKSRNVIEVARSQVARSISAKPDQIIFTSGGTESNNQVFWSLLNSRRNHIVSNVIEHPAGCSITLETIWLRRLLSKDQKTWLFDSVPPLVKIIWSGFADIDRAT